jgi:hypothetical protein
MPFRIPLLTAAPLALVALVAAGPDSARAQPGAGAATGASSPPLALAPGMEQRPQGVVRLHLPPSAAEPDAAARAALERLGASLAATPAGRVTVEAQVSEPAADVSAARRLSLARALAVRQALVAGGIAETRVDVRALGRTPDALDAVDVLPPGAARTATR